MKKAQKEEVNENAPNPLGYIEKVICLELFGVESTYIIPTSGQSGAGVPAVLRIDLNRCNRV